MKKILLLLLIFPFVVFGQSVPQGINYQAVARDANGDVLMNNSLSIQFSIISDITTANVSWQETHQVTTNIHGLFTAIIGQGISTSVGSSLTFDLIDWGASNHLLKVEIDYGNGLIDMGTTAFMSVPYSLNTDPTDELQSLSISGDTIFISDANYIVIPGISLVNNLIVHGCTDSTAFNYDALANIDDGSCIAIVSGCTDSIAFNYDSLANTNDGSCVAVVSGCTNGIALNYDPSANTDDGSCIVEGCTEPLACNYNSNANSSNLSICDFSCYSCSDSTACNYDPTASIPQSYINLFGIPWDSFDLQMNLEMELGYSDYYFIENQIDFCDQNYINGFDCDCSESYISNMNHGFGNNSYVFTPYICGDTAMSGNTSGYANVDVEYPCNITSGFWSESSGYCVINITIPATMSQFTIANSSGYVEYNIYYDSQFTSINQVNVGPYVVLNLLTSTSVPCQTGCTDPLYTEYNPLANTDDGSCSILIVNGCTDSTAFNYNSLANNDDSSCIAIVNGCTDSIAINYDSLANTNDGSCIAIVNGCTDSIAFNYDQSANTDDGSCIGACPNPFSVAYTTSNNMGGNNNTLDNNPNFSYISVGSSPVVVYFNDGLIENNYDYIFITDENGTLLNSAPYFNVTGQTFTSNGSINIEFDTDGSVTGSLNWEVFCAVVNGCTDPTANNYNSEANTDDGSCCYVAGCMDATANNYDPAVCLDDGSCLYHGCTDASAFNYDPTANFDDGSCIYAVINQPLQFNFTGSMQQITVPNGVTSVLVDAYGASGGDQNCCGSGVSGRGGRVQATLNVTAGEILYIYVGGEGNSTSGAVSGGWNGGGGATYNHGWSASAGGGASDIRISGTSLQDRKIVAGGGGGFYQNKNGGHGGGLVGQSGQHYGGTGGTQTSGGAPYTGGSSYNLGTFGVGGDGNSNNYQCGSGGGGWYGGGAGPQFLLNGISWAGGTGGGGSSYTDSIRTVSGSVNHTQGVKIGHGEITITFQ